MKISCTAIKHLNVFNFIQIYFLFCTYKLFTQKYLAVNENKIGIIIVASVSVVTISEIREHK